ncbi:MAG: rhodanese-like domain-containing protein, partial [Anaerolineae bacterium]
ETGVAAVVDPQRDTAVYEAEAGRHGMRIRHAILTHFHADFVAGHLELRDALGASISLGAQADAEYAFSPLPEDQPLEFGRVRLRAMETPGHTPESITILVYDLETSDESPLAALTGDTLFVGDVGRPDLRVELGWSADQLGRMLYESLQKLLELPDDTLVGPAHGAGSLCGKYLSPERVSTIGTQRRSNYALQPMSRDEFVRAVLDDQPEAPRYFTYDAVLNTKERQTLPQMLESSLRPLSYLEVQDLTRDGAQALDVRDPTRFAEGHLPGSINIPLGGTFASWVGALLDPKLPIVLVPDPGTEKDATVRLGRIGFDQVAGYLEPSAVGPSRLTEQSERISAPDLARELASANPPLIVDVRRPHEWEASRIEGSLNIPLASLPDRMDEIPLGKRVIVHCATGHRSAIAASLLESQSGVRAADLIGGMVSWSATLARSG